MRIIALALFLTGSPTARLLINTLHIYSESGLDQPLSGVDSTASDYWLHACMHACICTHDGGWNHEQKRRQHGVEHIVRLQVALEYS